MNRRAKPTPAQTPEEHAAHARAILKVYRDRYDRGCEVEDQLVTIDLMADLMHHAGTRWAEFEATARMHYDAEVRGE